MTILDKLPVFEKDYFLQYRPFPIEPKNYYQAHWHEIVASLIFYTSLQYISHIVSPIIFGDTYKNFPRKTRINFDIHVVSMVQCILSIALLIPTINHPFFQNRVEDPYNSIFGYTPYGGFVASVTLGYFVWDTIVCLRYFNLFGPGFLVHGVSALYVFGLGLRPILLPWIPAFLSFELSTPFVNINWFANRVPSGIFPNWLVTINGLLLLVTFFCVRILWGFYAIYLLSQDLFKVWHQLPLVLPVSVLSLNVVLNWLNVYWFTKMVAIARKKFLGKGKTE